MGDLRIAIVVSRFWSRVAIFLWFNYQGKSSRASELPPKPLRAGQSSDMEAYSSRVERQVV